LNVPIIVLSVKGEERTKVEALDSGADDYVTKPFGIDELLARVRANIRRANGEGEAASLDAGDFRVDLDARRVHVRGSEVRLTPKEFELFLYMARHPSRVLTHRTLLEAVWRGSQEQPGTSRLHGAAPQEARARSVQPTISRHRAVGGHRFNPQG
jgi:two-component system KDP operon response regulator KdpE